MRMRQARAWLVAVLLVTAACANTDTRAPDAEVKDSAGIRIVTSRRPAQTEPWTVDAGPTVEIGGNEEDTTQILFRVAGAVVLEDGRIVVAHGPAPMIRWFDASGAYVGGAGRPGGGPGEFGSGEGAWISQLWRVGADSVAAWEHPNRRMQVFGPDGQFARAVVLDLPPRMDVQSYPQMVGPLDDGFIMALFPPFGTRTVGEVWRDPITYIRYRSDGSYAGELATLPGHVLFTQLYRTPDGSEVEGPGRPPFSPAPAAWAAGDRLIYGPGDRYEIASYDTAGALTMVVRRPQPRLPVTNQIIAADKARIMADAPDDPVARRNWEASIDAAPFPDSLPAHRRIRMDRAGMLWVQDYVPPGEDSVTWSIFDEAGIWQAELTIPADWQVLDIGEDYMLVLVTDELDVERVRRHTLHRKPVRER